MCVPYLLRGPLTDLRQTWWVYVGGPPICPWGVLFRKGQRVDESTGHFHFPLYYICASLTPHAATAPFPLLLASSSLILRLLLHCISMLYVGAPRNCPWGVLFLKGQWVDESTGRRVNGSNGSHLNGVCRWTSQLPSWVLFRKGQQVDGSTGQQVDGSNGSTGQQVTFTFTILYMIADDARLTPPSCKKHTAYDDTRLTPHHCKKHTASFARSTGKFPSILKSFTYGR